MQSCYTWHMTLVTGFCQHSTHPLECLFRGYVSVHCLSTVIMNDCLLLISAVLWLASSKHCKLLQRGKSIFYIFQAQKTYLLATIFSAHLTLLEASSCCRHLSVCLSVCLSNAWIVTKRDNNLSICQHVRQSNVSTFLRPNFVVLSLGVHPERVC